MKQIRSARDILGLAFSCPSSIAVNDDVIISGSRAVITNNAEGSLKHIGRVSAHRAGETECTVDCRFPCHVTGRVSGAALHVGPFVLDASCKGIDYDPEVHDPFAIVGIAITPTTGVDQTFESLEP